MVRGVVCFYLLTLGHVANREGTPQSLTIAIRACLLAACIGTLPVYYKPYHLWGGLWLLVDSDFHPRGKACWCSESLSLLFRQVSQVTPAPLKDLLPHRWRVFHPVLMVCAMQKTQDLDSQPFVHTRTGVIFGCAVLLLLNIFVTNLACVLFGTATDYVGRSVYWTC